MSAELSRD
jgi:hypothetical protein